MYGRARSIEATAETVEQTPRSARSDDAITVGELEDARLGLFHLLSRRFGREFKERHGDDLFAQAAYEFSRKLDQGEEIENPAAWITRCGLNRATTEYESRDWRPRFVPTESLPAEPIAEASWEPEESFLSEDRVRKVHKAVEQLPVYQRQLLARHYFEGQSVREASRQLGWTAAKGARAHNAARKKLASIFDGLNSSDVALEVGVVAFFSCCAAGRETAAELPGGVEGALQRIAHGAAEAWHKAVHLARHPLGGGRPTDLVSSGPQAPGRISQLGRRIIASPVAETAASAGDGPGRMVEVCKYLAVCAVSGTAVTAGIIGTGGGHQHGHPTPMSPAPRHVGKHPTQESPAQLEGPTPAATVAPTSAETSPTSEGSPTGPSSVAHSISRSKAAAPVTVKEKQAAPEEGEQEERSSPREAFGAFEGRGESGSAEPESSAEVNTLSEAKTSSAATRSSESSSSPPPSNESAEKQAEAEQFRGALR